jgi:hypothetical protein
MQFKDFIVPTIFLKNERHVNYLKKLSLYRLVDSGDELYNVAHNPAH